MPQLFQQANGQGTVNRDNTIKQEDEKGTTKTTTTTTTTTKTLPIELSEHLLPIDAMKLENPEQENEEGAAAAEKEEEEEEEEKKKKKEEEKKGEMILKTAMVDKGDILSYDLGNLTAFDVQPISTTVGVGMMSTQSHRDRETLLQQVTRENVQLFINHIFGLSATKTQDGVIVTLPPPTTPIPREKPLPEPKAETKWERFAKLKGIKKRKRSRKVWDENTSEWRPRYGYNRVNSDADEWVIEDNVHGPENLPDVDPFTAKIQDKKERVEKQKTREAKNRKAELNAKTKSSLPGVLAINNSSSFAETSNETKPNKTHYSKALDIANKSTASIGKFNSQLPNETKKKQRPFTGKQSFAPVTPVETDQNKEKVQGLKVLDKIMKKDEGSLDLNKGANQHMRSEQTKNRDKSHQASSFKRKNSPKSSKKNANKKRKK